MDMGAQKNSMEALDAHTAKITVHLFTYVSYRTQRHVLKHPYAHKGLRRTSIASASLQYITYTTGLVSAD